MDNFDKEIKKYSRVAWSLFVLIVISNLMLFGGLIYVAIHFLSKIW